MAKKTTKSATQAAKRPAMAKSAKAASKPANKAAAKASVKATPSKKESAADNKKTTAKSGASRPALMTARGKVKAEVVQPAPKTESKAKHPAQRVAPSESSHEFDSSGDQLIAMAKEEMSKINKTGDNEKGAEKSSKFKPIKIERGNAADEKAKWQELNKRYGKEKAVPYKMSESFESLKPIQHKVLGWGFILSNDNNRLEVLFENGIKMLISNYKAN